MTVESVRYKGYTIELVDPIEEIYSVETEEASLGLYSTILEAMQAINTGIF